MAAANDRLRIARGNVVVRRDDADVIIRGVPYIRALGNLLLVEKPVVLAADRCDFSGGKPITLSASRSVGRLDGLVQRGNVIAEHLHYAAEICRNPGNFRLLI